MRTETFTIYTFEELSGEVQAVAIENARERFDYGLEWGDKWRETIQVASETLGLIVDDWSVNPWGRSHARVEMRDDVAASLSGVRAWKWLHSNGVAEAIREDCPFTGYCGDESFLDPMRAFLKKPTDATLQELVSECADSWAKAWAADMEYLQSDEAIRESLIANGREFTANGGLY
tara:strand:+ start:4040 stop:4567 length:528 start_codon:yes stop_codon:yes gene_type:complete